MNVKQLHILLFLSISQVHSINLEHYWTSTYIKAKDGFWGEIESVSGPGSTLQQTQAIRDGLEQLIKNFAIKSILDLPCGDFNWIKLVDLSSCFYIGCDIVKPMIETNIKQYSDTSHIFLCADATKDALPKTDLILCRDLLVHLSFSDIKKVLHNFKKSGAKYLLTTTFFVQRYDTNSDIVSGGWRPLNLQNNPFNFPEPIVVINEHCTEKDCAQEGAIYNDKSLALWNLNDITL